MIEFDSNFNIFHQRYFEFFFSANKANILQEVDLKVRSANFCQSAMDSVVVFEDEREEFYSNGLFCAGGEKGKDSCQGDSGSAIFSKTEHQVTQIGLVSGTLSNLHCGTEGIPTFYTRVSYFLKWILDNLLDWISIGNLFAHL